MQRRMARWLVALMIVAGGGVLPAILILRAPDAGRFPTPIAGGPSADAPVAGATPTRPRLNGITKSNAGSREAPLQFTSSAAPTRATLPIPATVDDPHAGVRRASTETSTGPALGTPRGEAAPRRTEVPAAPPGPLTAADAVDAQALPNPASDAVRVTLPAEQRTAPPPAVRTAIAPPSASTFETVDDPISPPVEQTTAMRRAARHNQDGFALAAKGAWYSARAEFHSALELEVAGADALEGASTRSRALREARTALREASDFAPRGRTAASRLDVAHLVAGHQSRVIDADSAAAWTAAAAHEAYLAYAKRRLADAGAGRQAASVALHGLGKVHAALGAGDRESLDHRKKARICYEAALEVGPDNFIASNDLAVLLAEEGDLERGRMVLETGLRISRQPAMLNNLAGIYRRMGHLQAAEQVRIEAVTLQQRAAAGPGDLLPTHDVRWLDPGQFAATARGGADAGRTPSTGRSPLAQPAAVYPLNTPIPSAEANVAGPQTPASSPVRVPATAGRPVRNALVY